MRRWAHQLLADTGEMMRSLDRAACDRAGAMLYEAAGHADLQPDELDYIENHLAWSLVVTEREGAIAYARRVVDRLPPASPLWPHALGTLACALAVAGRAAEAEERFGRVLRLPMDPAGRAAQLFYLGTALLALGRPEEARDAWQQVRRVDPDGAFALLADGRLLALDREHPYR